MAIKKDGGAVGLGRRGGKKGGPARAGKMTPEQRSESARKAVSARGTKAKNGSGNIILKNKDTGIKTFHPSLTPVPYTSNTALHLCSKRLRFVRPMSDIELFAQGLHSLGFDSR